MHLDHELLINIHEVVVQEPVLPKEKEQEVEQQPKNPIIRIPFDERLLSSDKHLDYLVGDVLNYATSYIYHFYQNNPGPKTLYVPKELLVYLKDAFDFGIKYKEKVDGK